MARLNKRRVLQKILSYLYISLQGTKNTVLQLSNFFADWPLEPLHHAQHAKAAAWNPPAKDSRRILSDTQHIRRYAQAA